MMKHKGDWLLLLAAFIGGGGFISLKYLLDWGYDPFQVIFGRFLTASVCLCLVYCKRLKRITKEEWRVGSILGALLAAMFLLMTVGLQYTTPSVNAFLVNIPAVIVPFVCWGVFRQKPNRNCDSVHIAIVENLSTLAVMTVILMFTGWDMPLLTLPAFGNFFYAGAFCTALYFVLQSIGQQSTAPNKAAIIITTESIFAAVFSAILYGERMHFRGYLGCAVIFAAMALAEKPVQERK